MAPPPATVGATAVRGPAWPRTPGSPAAGRGEQPNRWMSPLFDPCPLCSTPPRVIGRAREVRVEAQYPDDFVMHLLDLAPNLVFSGTKRQGESLKNPPLGVEQYLESL